MINLGNTIKEILDNAPNELKPFLEFGLIETHKGSLEDSVFNVIKGFVFEVETKQELKEVIKNKVHHLFYKSHFEFTKNYSIFLFHNTDTKIYEINVFIIKKDLENKDLSELREFFEQHIYTKIIDNIESLMLFNCSEPLKNYLMLPLINLNFTLKSKLELLCGGNIYLIEEKDTFENFQHYMGFDFNKSEIIECFDQALTFSDYNAFFEVSNNSGGNLYLIKRDLINNTIKGN
jgi:hypothetical protein